MDIEASDLNLWGDEEFQDEDFSPAQAQQEAGVSMSQPTGPAPSAQMIAAMRQAQMEHIVSERVASMLMAKEDELDEKINRMENRIANLGGEELEDLRARRQEELERRQRQRQDWLTEGHGKMTEIQDTREFFTMVKASSFAIVLFYSKTSKWCNMLREHLTLLCRAHLECRFLQVNAENVPYLVEKLSVFMMPTLLLVKERKIVQQLRGLDWVAPDGKMTTHFLEDRLHAFGFFEDCVVSASATGGSARGGAGGSSSRAARATMKNVVNEDESDSDGLDLD